MTKIALYAGSFDPLTNGHMDILAGCLRIADKVFVAVGVHPTKKSLFNFEERAHFITQAAQQFSHKDQKRFEVIAFDTLLVDLARKIGATLSVRGLRDGTDFDYEMKMVGMNEVMAPQIQTVFLPASISHRAITSTLIRQIASMGGDVSPFVPKDVALALEKKFKK